MSLEIKQLILSVAAILFVVFLIFMSRWARKMREDSGWALLEQRYPQKDKFLGTWLINKPLKLAAIKGHHTVDIGADSLYLYLRPTQHGDILKKSVQIPWSAVEKAALVGDFIELKIMAGKNIVLGLDYSASSKLEQIPKLLSKET